MSGGEAVFADTAREGGALAENITHFARALRAAGLKVGRGRIRLVRTRYDVLCNYLIPPSPL